MSIQIRKIVFAGVVAAFYAALTIMIAPISYGPVQIRLAEALCILPFYYPITALGLFIGCVIANLFSPYGILDIVAGSVASLLSALLTMQLGRIKKDTITIKAIACFPPVFFNALIIGAVIAWSETNGGDAFWPALILNGVQVGLGQLIIMYAVGLPLIIYLPKSYLFSKLSGQYRL